MGCSVQRKKGFGEICSTFQYLKEAFTGGGDGLWTRACSNRPRGNGLKLKACTFRLDIRKEYVIQRGCGFPICERVQRQAGWDCVQLVQWKEPQAGELDLHI